MVADAAEAERFPKRGEIKQMAAETAAGVRAGIERMDQTDEDEALVRTLVAMIEEKRLHVRVYTKERLHAKAYIFDYGAVFNQNGKAVERHEEGIAVVGSSNLTLAGVTHNTELNVVVQGNANHAELVRWFEDLWQEAQEFDEALMQEMKASWAIAPVRPYDVYMKTLYALVRDRIEGGEDRDLLWDDDITRQLADFQQVAVKQAVQIIRDYGGAFVSDVVGLGKSYIGAAIVKHFERTEHARPLIICPATLTEMWERYNEVYQLNARVLSMGYLRWNPVRLIQRFGRIDRIGSEHTAVYGFNFLPETGIERNLGLREKLHNRIQEIHDTIGEDAAILDRSEHLNEEAMYAIYEKKGGQLSLFEDEEEFLDLNEAEEILRQLRRDDPAEYGRIADLRDGIRTGKPSPAKGLYAFCQAGRYQQLLLIDEKGDIVSRDIPRILGVIKCGPDLPSAGLPPGYNADVMRIKRRFAETVKQRQAERDHTLSLSQGQRYLLRELRVLFGLTADDEKKTRINILEKAFRGAMTAAMNRELNRIRRNGMMGDHLLKALTDLYHQHGMRDWSHRQTLRRENHEIPTIICSEALM
ncbi:MAG: hypothetical protein AUK26_10250 [Syntrophaceae bacterium CG2_30_58_14]|nr:MAG: hypothetical protein AUK26_10250 [Syntrophaceae bacterium CG2_30_58_14]